MLKVRFFLTDPYCELSEYYAEMIPRLSQKYNLEIETICKRAAEFETDEYFELDLPMAPAVMVGGEIVTEGQWVGRHRIESMICGHLGLAVPKFDTNVLYEFLIATYIWLKRGRIRWKARNLGRTCTGLNRATFSS